MEVEHPRAVSDAGPLPAAVDVDGETVPVDEHGFFEVPDGTDGWLQRFAAAHGVEYDDEGQCKRPQGWPDQSIEDATPDTCETVKDDGEVCGRELPCPYHSDDEGSD